MFTVRPTLRTARFVRCRRNVRLQSTSTGPSTAGNNSAASHALAGVAGGSIVVVAGYAYYHFSGTKKVIDSAKSMKDSFVSTTKSITEKAPSSNQILSYMRQTAKSYSMLIPGAGQYIDSTFDSFDSLAETHGEDMDKILKGSYDELVPVVQNGSLDQATAMKVFEILKRRTGELQDLASRAGADALGPILDRHPEIKEKLGGSYDEFKQLVSKAGPEAGKIMSETAKQMKDVFKNGFDEKSIERAKEVLQKAVAQVSEGGAEKGKEAWEKAKKQAQPYLDKFPEISSLLNEKAAVLMGSGAGGKAIWDRLKELGEVKGEAGKEKAEEVKKFIEQKAEEASGSSGDMWDRLQELAKNIPGADKMLEGKPDMKQFVLVLKDNSEEAKDLAKETFDEVMSVLQDKAQKAKKLAEKTKEEAKDGAKGKKQQ